MVSTNFQRIGSTSNSQVGRDFEGIAIEYFKVKGIHLEYEYKIPIGIGDIKKDKRYDLGTKNPAVIVECKSHTWTITDKSPSAKLTVWNEAMYYFHMAPKGYKKYFFVLRDFSQKRQMTLCEYYCKRYAHMIPEDVVILEFDPESAKVIEYTDLHLK